MSKKYPCDGCGKQEFGEKLRSSEGKGFCGDCASMKFTPGRGTCIGGDESSIGGFDGMGMGGALRIPMGGILGGYGGGYGGLPEMPLPILAGVLSGDLKTKGCYDTPMGKVCVAKKTKKGKGSK